MEELRRGREGAQVAESGLQRDLNAPHPSRALAALRDWRPPSQILKVLIAHMAKRSQKFLDRRQQIFTKHHTLGADEQDYTDTAAYAEQFIHHVMRLRDRERRG